MRSIIAVILVLFSLGPTQAQRQKLDSLDRLISRAASDTARINLLNTKTGLLNETNLDSALVLGLKTVDYARRIHYQSGEALARIRLGYCYSFKGNYVAAQQNLQQAESIYTTQKDAANLLKVYNTYGILYGMQSKYDSSITSLKKGIRVAQQSGNTVGLGRIYLNIGISYDMLSNRPQALQYQQQALALAESTHDANQQAICQLNMANTYQAMDDQPEAERRYQKALALARQEGIKNIELYAYSNLASIYTAAQATQRAYEFAIKAARLAQQMGDQGIQAASLSKAATNLAHQKKYAQAQKLGQWAITIANKSQQPLNIHQAYAGMGMILKMQNEVAEAIPYYEKSFAVLKAADIYNEQTGESYADLSACYEKTGNYSRALATHKIAAAISDSVRGKENIRKATQLSMTYEFNKQQQALKAEQQKKNALASTRQAALSGGMVLMLIVAAVSYYAYRTKQKSNALLEDQKAELQQTLTKLQTTQAQLIQSEKMASLGELTAGIAHEIQNPLNFVTTFSELSINLLENITKGHQQPGSESEANAKMQAILAKNLGKINHHGKRAAAIVTSMLEHSGTGSGQPQLTNLNTLTEEYLRLTYQGLKAKGKDVNARLITHFDASLPNIEVMPQEFGRVLLNLFNNAFYAVWEKQKMGIVGYQPTIRVYTEQKPGKVDIRIGDNGNGIADSVVEKIFQPFFTTKPTGQGTGLGLSLSYDIVTKGHGGTLTVKTQVGEYTEFLVSLPSV